MIDGRDRSLLERALDLAWNGRATAPPNPLVGAVVTRGGEVVGEGWHRRAGESHAEIVALRSVSGDTRGCTVYVNLEPCAHQGRTPPCVDSLLEAGVGRVVCCHGDPNPQARGGAELLRERGVEVAFLDPAVEAQNAVLRRALWLNVRFLVPLVHGRPTVTLKWAMSVDGRIATRTGESQWISSDEGRRWALELRETHGAILVGSGTALADDPRLDRRLGLAEGPITRVVLDRRLRWAPPARMFEVEGPVVVVTRASEDDPETEARAGLLRDAGAVVVELDDPSPPAVVARLAQEGVDSVLVEGGSGILGAFADAGLCDRVAVCCAPLLLGGEQAPGPVGGKGVARLADALRFEPVSAPTAGPDTIIQGIEGRCSQVLSQSVVTS